MSDPNRIPSDRDDEWREADMSPEDVKLRLMQDRRQTVSDDDSDRSGDGEDETY